MSTEYYRKVNIGMSNAAKPQNNNKKPSLTKEQIESAFKNFDVDNKQHGMAYKER